MSVDLAILHEDWLDQGICATTDPEIFFPDKGGSVREAKDVCGRCNVRRQCLAYALEHDERYGIWGGMSERDRRKLQGLPETSDTGACGTYPKGHQRHVRKGEVPCDDCQLAYDLYYRLRRENGRAPGPVDINHEDHQKETTMSQTDLRECTNCGDQAAYLSSRLWCDTCEIDAEDVPEAAIAPPAQPASIEMPDDGAGQLEPVESVASTTPALPVYVLQLAGLLADTEGHPDPLVRATRKIVTQASVALLQAVKASQTSGLATTTAVPSPTANPRSTSPAEPEGTTPAQYRAWALANGHEVAANGRVPGYIKELYARAHQDAA